MKEARRHRKLFGGGMRQVGIIAAGALYALENNFKNPSRREVKEFGSKRERRTTIGMITT